ncbi:MAG: ankyrin repeat domain-containing protein [Pseudomonadota bacterium]
MCLDRLAPDCFDAVVAHLSVLELVRLRELSTVCCRLFDAHPFRPRPTAPLMLWHLWRSCSAPGMTFLWKLFGRQPGIGADTWHTRHIVTYACEHGQLAKLQWLLAKGLVQDAEVRSGYGAVDTLRVACINGQLPTAQWLAAHLRPTASDVVGVLAMSCANGHLAVAQWLTARFNLTVSELKHWTTPLRVACAHGHYATVVWATTHFDIASIASRAEIVGDLASACLAGHLNVARWLAERFSITRADLADLGPLHDACHNGHLEVAQWLAARFELTATDVRCGERFAPADDNRPLRLACAGGHLPIAQWLTETFALTAADAVARDNYAIYRAAENGHGDVVAWLGARFNLSTAVIVKGWTRDGYPSHRIP